MNFLRFIGRMVVVFLFVITTYGYVTSQLDGVGFFIALFGVLLVAFMIEE